MVVKDSSKVLCYCIMVTLSLHQSVLLVCRCSLFLQFVHQLNPLGPHDALKHIFASLKDDLFPTTMGFRMKIFMELF